MEIFPETSSNGDALSPLGLRSRGRNPLLESRAFSSPMSAAAAAAATYPARGRGNQNEVACRGQPPRVHSREGKV